MQGTVWLVSTLISVYSYLLLARIVISWIGVSAYNPWIRLLVRITDPFLDPFRAVIPPIAGLDFSPLLAFFVLNMLRTVLVRFLMNI
jgi:YggT family protein